MTPEMRQERARAIAKSLNDHRRWRSHGRSIPMRTLQEELKLLVDDFGANKALLQQIKAYYEFIMNCMATESLPSFVTSREFV